MRIQKVFGLAVSLVLAVIPGTLVATHQDSGEEAPTGYATPTYSENAGSHSQSNGFIGPAGDTFVFDQVAFEESEGVNDGLGPIYNARSCVDCHQNPVTGGSSQISEFRAGHTGRRRRFEEPDISIDNGHYVISNRSLVNDRAICPEAQEQIGDSEDIRTFRMSLSTLGDGFVEAIDDSTLLSLARQQRILSEGQISGQAIQVPVLEAPATTRIGRFGWKDQHASLLSFSADAYLNEQGITSRLQPTDLTTVCKTTEDPEDETDESGLSDIDHFADFMRGTMAPPVDADLSASRKAQNGKGVFEDIGCAMCHVPSITTAPVGTAMNGGAFTVPAALGGKVIHPYGDFLLHDVGTGDGIQQNGPPETADKLRTPPLWGLRTRNRLMHDGLSITVENAILRHDGEASRVIRSFRRLSRREKEDLMTFLSSL